VRYLSLRPGYLMPASIARPASNLHTADSLNKPHRYSCLFAYFIEASENPKTLKVPNNSNIRVLVISTEDENQIVAALSFSTVLNGAEPVGAWDASMPG